MHMYNFLCSDSLLYFFLFLSTLHSVYTRDCSCVSWYVYHGTYIMVRISWYVYHGTYIMDVFAFFVLVRMHVLITSIVIIIIFRILEVHTQLRSTCIVLQPTFSIILYMQVGECISKPGSRVYYVFHPIAVHIWFRVKIPYYCAFTSLLYSMFIHN